MTETNPERTNTQLAKINNIYDSKMYLAKEFLTWLWYQVETGDPIKLKSRGEGTDYDVDLWIDDRVVLESATAVAHKQSLTGGTPSQSAEAAAGLKTGKFIKEIKLCFVVNSLFEFGFTLNNKDLFPRSLRLPPQTEESADEPCASVTAYRIKMLDLFFNVFDLLFEKFITARATGTWESQELKKIRKWITARTSQEPDVAH